MTYWPHRANGGKAGFFHLPLALAVIPHHHHLNFIDIAPYDTHYLNPLALALYQTCHHSSHALDTITPALAARLNVADKRKNPLNTRQ